MNHPSFLILFGLFVVTTNCTRFEPLDEDRTEAVEAARAELAEATLNRDLAALDRIYSEEYLLTNRRGLNRTKQDRLRMLGSGELQYLSVGEDSEVTTAVYGNVAVVRGLVGSATYVRAGDTLQTGPRRFIAVWAHNGERWQQVARQHTSVVSSEIPPPSG
jgi:ketosteroid isomerase-like protein